MIRRIWFLSLLATGFALSTIFNACSGTETITGGGTPDVYYGRFEADEVAVADVPLVDSIQLVIRGNRYTIFNYPIPGEDMTVDFCNSGGILIGFGTNEVTFSPSDTVGSNCDRVHIPQGKMNASYNGDSVSIRDTVAVTFVRQRDRGIIDTVTQQWGLTVSLRQK